MPLTRQHRETLRTAFDTAVSELPNSSLLTNAFNAKIGDAVFEAHVAALSDEHDPAGGPARLHVVSAPMGTGKTSFAVAFHAALTRASAVDPALPYGSVLLVNEREKADTLFRDLSKLVPGRVAVWTSDHDSKCTKPEKVPSPAARFNVADLERHTVAIVTTQFYKGKRGHRAQYVLQGGDERKPRGLITIDEQPEDVRTFDATLTQASQVADATEETSNAQALNALRALVLFMSAKSCADDAPPLETPKSWSVAPELQWFTTHAATAFAEAHRVTMPGVENVFGFGRTLANGYAFVSRYTGGTGTHFVGYESTLKLPGAAVLLDATADLDGITQLSPWRSHVTIPQARYSNLTIVHVEPLRRSSKSLATYLKGAKEQQTYVTWMVDTIKANIEPGQRGLVVCKEMLFENRNVPSWPIDDLRFDDPASYQRDYAWSLEGRQLCATHWGTGIGSNQWKDADVVFLFDEHHLPRRTVIAQTQGHMRAKATQGALATMRTPNSKSRYVDTIAEGHLLRQLKQMALRGRGRSFDEHGVCGSQKLVFAGDYQRLLVHADRLFPGATMPAYTVVTDKEPNAVAKRLVEILSSPGYRLLSQLSTATIESELGISWRAWSHRLLEHPAVQAVSRQFGWTYVTGKGRSRSKFVRDTQAALPVAA